MRLLTYLPLGGTFSLLWPKKSVAYGEQVTSDKFYYETDQLKKQFLARSLGNSDSGDQMGVDVIAAEKLGSEDTLIEGICIIIYFITFWTWCEGSNLVRRMA